MVSLQETLITGKFETKAITDGKLPPIKPRALPVIELLVFEDVQKKRPN
jgi:hypothetical protein